MNKFLIESKEDLEILIINTATKMGISQAVVEKDYWVCVVLDYLFNESKWKDAFTFKGGTSLSKCFRLIERFSEDIDLILDWRVLGYEKNEPWDKRSNTQQDKFNKEVNQKTEDFLQNQLMKDMERDFREKLHLSFEFFINEQEPQSIQFEYPKIFPSPYLTQNIKLEIGSLAAWTPAMEVEIEPYIGEYYPNVFKEKTKIRTVSPQRTFWEKATILHQEANRSENKRMPRRYARHYYDLYKIANSEVKIFALKDKDLLEQVTKFKMKFYPCNWAKYEDVLNGNLKLIPDQYRFDEIQKDYEDMREMIYGEYPDFEELMKNIKEIEKELASKLNN
ncbi:MAG: nucleotidyl transferase AbiEii/AbiGii toxin family protein [Clostridiaceae bacterium]|nr:nucleotidyl transferase AbiEii/AbiGii toxin family protein [Clostridiaceae bacterium]